MTREGGTPGIAVIGGGLTGLMTAAALSHAGPRVHLIDRAESDAARSIFHFSASSRIMPGAGLRRGDGALSSALVASGWLAQKAISVIRPPPRSASWHK